MHCEKMSHIDLTYCSVPNDLTYKTCTWDGDSMVGAWCSTKSGDSGQRLGGMNWGNCRRGCPIPPRPKGTENMGFSLYYQN